MNDMRQLPQWVVWNFGKPDKKTGKRPKITFNLAGNYKASPVDPENFVTYDEAKAALGKFDGIGFSLLKTDPYVVVDLDNCFKDGKPLPWVNKIMKKVGESTAVDISPSGEGVHILLKGELPEGHGVKPKWKDHTIEVYSENRFITMPENFLVGDYDSIGKTHKSFLKKLTTKMRLNKKTYDTVDSGKSVEQIVTKMKQLGTWPTLTEEWKSEEDYRFLHTICDAVEVADFKLICDVFLASDVAREKVADRIDYHVARAIDEHDWKGSEFETYDADEPGLTMGKPIGRGELSVEVIESIDNLIAENAPIDDVITALANLTDTIKRGEYIIAVAKAYPIGMVELKRLVSFKRNSLIKPQFPDWQENVMGGVTYISTYENLEKLVHNKIKLEHHYDVILKDTVTLWRPTEGGTNHILGKLRSHVLSEAVKSALPKGIIEDHFDVIMKSNEKNPLMAAVESVEWDGKDRIKELEKRIGSDTGDKEYRRTIIKRWMIQAIAAWDGCERTPNKQAIAKYEYILTLEGGQGVNKTTLFTKMMPGPMNRYFASGVFLKPTDRDSVKQVTSFGMCELGEIDATFKKADIAEIKAFLSAMYDTYRAAYARDDERHARRTVFCASVNGTRFLNDQTGARRFLVLHLSKVMDLEGFDFGQLWAQIFQLYLAGEKWWIERGEKAWDIQKKVNDNATDGGVVDDAIMHFKERLSKCNSDSKMKRVSATKIWEALMGKGPNKLERAGFISTLELHNTPCDKSGVSIPVDFNLL